MAFLQRVFRSAREAEFAAVQWSDAERDAFFEGQSALQERHYREQIPNLERHVVLLAGEPVGRLYLASGPDEARLVDIALLPQHRGRGVGRVLLGRILEDARRTNRRVSLHVERENPAHVWYGRLGFKEAGTHGVYVQMVWTP